VLNEHSTDPLPCLPHAQVVLVAVTAVRVWKGGVIFDIFNVVAAFDVSDSIVHDD
jgi:hypothetical protein